jgi:hypothetical protein
VGFSVGSAGTVGFSGAVKEIEVTGFALVAIEQYVIKKGRVDYEYQWNATRRAVAQDC